VPNLLLADLEARRPVWQALSNLFLDTDTSLSRDWRVNQLARSPYSIAELEQILVNEVYPICRTNLFCIAGEWAGFDPAWLETRITCRLSSRFRVFHTFNLGRFTVRLSIAWRATKRAVAALREAHPSSP
jgi:hypothetical protein